LTEIDLQISAFLRSQTPSLPSILRKQFKGHGWLGIRYQTRPDGEANEVIVHVRLHEDNAKYQQETIGAMGVNLIYAAFNYFDEPKKFLLSLYDGIEKIRH